MKNRNRQIRNGCVGIILWVTVFSILVPMAAAQATGEPKSAELKSYERNFRQSKSAVERALKELQPALSGRLPVLEGFAVPGDHPLNRYQRAFFQSAVQVSSTASGGAVVRVSAKVTAWYADPSSGHSGYQLLTSNGRLENDFLDQLADLLTSTSSASKTSPSPGQGSSEAFPATSRSTANAQPASSGSSSGNSPANKATAANKASEPAASASLPNAPDVSRTLPSSSSLPSSPSSSSSRESLSREQGLSGAQLAETRNGAKGPSDPTPTGLQAEAAGLEEVIKNQVHPKNLVAIKKSGTPVVASPSLTAKTLFLASAEDEFEMLDYNADWVHVRVSGLSRGWIWRTSLEMPDGISDVPLNNANGEPVVADLFQVTREETAPFPGDWEPLRGKNVKIISVQKIQENEKSSGAQAKLEFAKSLLDKSYADLVAKKQELSGVVMIFDAIDGGMIAATLPTIQKWKAGTLSDAALWHQCYFDPPETFTVPSVAAGH